jgi:hypothetical protein
MTEDELQAREATLAEMSRMLPLGTNDSETAIHIGNELVAEVRRLRRHSEALKRLRLVQPSGTPPAVTEEVMDRVADFILGRDSDEVERRRDLREGSWDTMT